ncbi:MAG TPA: TRAP transporter small permease [Bacteroidota bacterium]|nr:TRAP transporter small permease [Bacteroidota bacterium]
MKILQRLDALLNKAEGALLILLLVVMLALAFLQVILRNFFSSGLLWADIVLRHLVLWVGFLGAALATSQERHISIDAFTRFLSPRLKHAMRVVTNLFAAVVCYYLMTASITFIQSEVEAGTTVLADIPGWYAEIIIPIGFGLLMVHFAVRVMVDGRAALLSEHAGEKA